MATATAEAPKTEAKPANHSIVLTAGAKAALEALRKAGKDPVASTAVEGLQKYLPELKAAGAITVSGKPPRGAKYMAAIPASAISPEDAPEREVRTRGPRKGTKSAAVSKSTRGPLPSPEAILRLVKAIQDEERKVNDTASAANDKKIAELQRRVGAAKGDDLTLAFQEMQKAMEERHTLGSRVREEAFKNVEASGIPEAAFLRYLSPSYD